MRPKVNVRCNMSTGLARWFEPAGFDLAGLDVVCEMVFRGGGFGGLQSEPN